MCFITVACSPDTEYFLNGELAKVHVENEKSERDSDMCFLRCTPEEWLAYGPTV